MIHQVLSYYQGYVKLSHLNEHKFRHDFKFALSSMCYCGSETETTDQFFCVARFFKI